MSDQGESRQAPRHHAPIIGRRRELDLLLDALGGAVAGRGALILVAGEAGIGKTRLVETLAEAAGELGVSVLWGEAWDAGGAPAYWPWTQALRDLLAERPAEELVRDLGSGAPFVAQIAPDVAGVYPAVEPAPTIDSDAARFAAFDATASFLSAAAARRPIVLVLEDLHAADTASARLLEFVAPRLGRARILVLVTCRLGPTATESEVTAALTNIRKAQRLTLEGLSRDDVEVLAASLAPGVTSARLVERLHRLTDGNPLFVDEVLRLLAARGALDAPNALRLPVPRAMRDTIRRRLEPLAPEVVDTLTTAAVIGPEFRLETLARTLGADREALLRRLDAAVVAGLVEERLGTIGAYRFSHALVRETLHAELSTPDRVACHARVAEALIAIYGDRAEAPLSVLAYHLLQAAPAGDAQRAADYAERAGHQALDAMAYEDAIDLFGQGLTVVEDDPRAPERRGRLLLAKGQAQIGAGLLADGRETLRAAAGAARDRYDPELLARAALAFAPWGLATATSDEEGLIPFLREALDGLPPGDGTLRARVLARLAAALYWTEEAEQRRALAEEALAIARRIGDPTTLAYVLSDAHRATWDPDSPTRALSWVDEVSALADRIGNAELGLAARSWRISLLLELGELADVDREIQTFAEAAQTLHQRRARAQSLLHRCARALLAGRYEEGQRLRTAADAECQDLIEHDPILGMRLGALEFVKREAQGTLAEIGDLVRWFSEAQPSMPVWRCGYLCVLLQAGAEDELRVEYDRLAARGFATLPRDNLWLPALALLTQACAHLGDARGAGELRAMLAPYSGHNVVTPDVAFLGPVDRYLALLAATEGDHDAAARYLVTAGALAREMGARPTTARLALDEARMLATRDAPAARRLAETAAAEADALGLEQLAADARGLAERLATDVPGPESAHAGAGATPTGGTPASAAMAAGAATGDATTNGGTPGRAAPAGGALGGAAPGAPSSLRFRRAGDMWELGPPGATFFVKDTLGLRHLARLLAHPGHDFHALDLARSAAPAATQTSPDEELTVGARGQEDLGSVLDDRAKAEFAERIRDLEETIEQAEGFHDLERASRAREELAALTDALSSAVSRSGRDRRPGSHGERARISVTKAIRTAIGHVEAKDATLGHHLGSCVHTGMHCAYRPGPDAPRWQVEP
ncbi:AAA family ATPase [Solirubrobacter phytolaccae]|uniref:AAA family ATPase n=2 Tax=Solirubrobacter phytolaccae TaxID=1404360 RepID=A0A9X3NB45_9ACTN|nr:AAA family ATPase [Solirubrobacter phytolaccae]